MSNSVFEFTEIDSSESFNNLGESLGGKAVNKCIKIPADAGTGSIRKFDFEKGLHIRSWDLKLNRQFTFNRRAEKKIDDCQAFTIIYVLSPDSVLLESPVLHKKVILQGSMNIMLISNCIDLDFHILPGHPVKALDITVSGEWMNNQFDRQDEAFIQFMTNLKKNTNPFLFIEKGNSAEYKIAMDIHDHLQAEERALFYLKAKTLSLISDFFSKTFLSNRNSINENNTTLHQEKMLMVEKILGEHLEKNLPSIEDIAHTSALSESTLKRHFKIMFGKSIYEYYLEMKMNHAKRLLLEKPLTVKEVAYRLGYEKTSNFIHMFKKFHSFSPGHLKKNISF